MTLSLRGAAGLAVGEALVFTFTRSTVPEEGFALRLATGWVAYVNRCPHWNVDLDYGDQRFYDAELDRIYCKNHGALFVPETGRCVAGPCAGDSLEPLGIAVRGDEVEITIPQLTITPA